MKNNLLKEAIADAKQLKESAIANAKLALEEAFTPRIKEMLATKIQEMEDSELEDETTNEEYNEDGNIENSPTDEDLSLEEILAELEASDLEEGGNTDLGSDEDEDFDPEMDETLDIDALLAEADDDKEDKPAPKKKTEPKTDKPKAEKPKPTTDSNGDGLEDTEDEEIGEMTIDELKDLIRSVIDGEDEEGEGMELAGMGDDDDDFKLDELLSEMEEYEDDVNEYNGKSPDNLESSIKGAQELAKMLDKGADWVKGEGKKLVSKTVADLNKALENIGAIAGKSMRSESENELEEINQLKNELNETNILNAKLLYSNKIFRSNTLNESQKLRVINSFDKAKNVGETKLIYETIKDSFSVNKDKKQIKESLGFASKPTGNTSTNKTNIVGAPDEMVARFQKLAGITPSTKH